MILLLDCGNTLVKFAWLQNEKRSPAQALPYEKLDDFSIHLNNKPKLVLGTSVTSQEIKSKLEQKCLRTWGLSIHWCSYDNTQKYLNSDYAHGLGSDRWLAVLGLWHQVKSHQNWLNGQPYILASFGTATTVDTIFLEHMNDGTKQARFMGGLILPGADMMRKSLAQGTAELPLAQGNTADFPLDTNSAINSGVIAAQSGAVLRQLQKAMKLGSQIQPQLYVCGGAWPKLSKYVLAELNNANNIKGLHTLSAKQIDNPVLDGLALIASQQ